MEEREKEKENKGVTELVDQRTNTVSDNKVY